MSFETSPATVDREKLNTIRSLGADRLSIGVQSFDERDLKELGRPQRTDDVRRACAWARDAGFPVLNLDLIYGAAAQTPNRWLRSLQAALECAPEELYLYPLYVRQLTGLGRAGKRASAHRRELYRVARDYLLGSGYQQVSMRFFRRENAPPPDSDYCCQEDGMVGLGPGARSYTRSVHYSTEYAVAQQNVRRIISLYTAKPRYDVADFGVVLNAHEQRRRHVIKSLLRSDGLDLREYERRFDTPVLEDLPELLELPELELAEVSPTHMRLTALGLERSDTIGPWLYSAEVQAGMNTCELK